MSEIHYRITVRGHHKTIPWITISAILIWRKELFATPGESVRSRARIAKNAGHCGLCVAFFHACRCQIPDHCSVRGERTRGTHSARCRKRIPATKLPGETHSKAAPSHQLGQMVHRRSEDSKPCPGTYSLSRMASGMDRCCTALSRDRRYRKR